MFERYWPQVATKLFTADGTNLGEIQVASAAGFKVGQLVILTSATQPNLELKVKRVPSGTLIIVGEKGSSIDDRTDVSAYLVADGAAITANFQKRVSIPLQEINRAVYEEEPTVAIRTIQVDKYGNPVGASGGAATDVNVHDGAGTSITSTADGPKQALDVHIANLGDLDLDVSIYEEGTQADVSSQTEVSLNSAGFTDILDVPISSGTTYYLTGLMTSIAAYGAEAELVYINGGPDVVIRHFYTTAADQTHFETLPRARAFAGGEGFSLRVRAQTAANMPPGAGKGWAAINGYTR